MKKTKKLNAQQLLNLINESPHSHQKVYSGLKFLERFNAWKSVYGKEYSYPPRFEAILKTDNVLDTSLSLEEWMAFCSKYNVDFPPEFWESDPSTFGQNLGESKKAVKLNVDQLRNLIAEVSLKEASHEDHHSSFGKPAPHKGPDFADTVFPKYADAEKIIADVTNADVDRYQSSSEAMRMFNELCDKFDRRGASTESLRLCVDEADAAAFQRNNKQKLFYSDKAFEELQNLYVSLGLNIDE
jgi:hypothetical protein